ncbi:hypothetical protein [Actinoplanes sp. NPDC051851]|uniref:hypothetical protein n=1 Tax=Actinoplanes sp. NPDC051851 TaxID=3154753 RepID=UPI003443DC2E
MKYKSATALKVTSGRSNTTFAIQLSTADGPGNWTTGGYTSNPKIKLLRNGKTVKTVYASKDEGYVRFTMKKSSKATYQAVMEERPKVWSSKSKTVTR